MGKLWELGEWSSKLLGFTGVCNGLQGHPPPVTSILTGTDFRYPNP